MRTIKREYLFSFLLALAGVTAHARIVRIDVTSDIQGEAAGVPATYHVIQGLAYGEIDPNDARDRIIQDIDLAPRNSDGNVEYIASFTLYAPIHPSAKAALIYAVVNRGGDQLPREYTSGDFYLLSGWQGDIRFGGASGSGKKAETIKVPIARNADGSSITRACLCALHRSSFGHHIAQSCPVTDVQRQRSAARSLRSRHASCAPLYKKV